MTDFLQEINIGLTHVRRDMNFAKYKIDATLDMIKNDKSEDSEKLDKVEKLLLLVQEKLDKYE